MAEMHREYVAAALEQQQKSLEQFQRLLDAAGPEAVFGKPIPVGDSQVFTAAETLSTLSFGFGIGGGGGASSEETPSQGQAPEPSTSSGAGGGGGGGGMSTARPVAIIRVEAQGVAVEPVVDVTKIALAAFTTLGAMFLMFAKMARRAR